jgi:putative ABC transport system permease protein
MIGTAAIVILVSLGLGLQQNFTSQLGGIGSLTQINVFPSYGEVKGGGGGGGGVMISGSSSSSVMQQQKLITPQTIKDLTDLPNVTKVIPRDYLQGGSTLKFGRLENSMQVTGIATKDLSDLDYQLKEGTLSLEPGTAIIGETLLDNFYDPQQRAGMARPDRPDVLNQQVKLIVYKYSSDGTQSTKTYPLKVAGIIKKSNSESDYTMYIPLDDMTKINEWINGKRINRTKDGYQNVIVLVSDTKIVLDTTNQITELGYQASTPQQYIQGINSFFVILQIVFGGVGAVALLVAAIGIANTMAMAILERTREIGLMKAIGATNRNVLSIFLGEAAGIGFVGGLGGTVLGWAGSYALNIVVMGYLSNQAASNGGIAPSQSIATPLWLPVFGLVFATLVGLLSGLYPALRAASLLPVTALKYE